MDSTLVGLGLFGLGVAVNAGIVWKGLAMLEVEFGRLTEQLHGHQRDLAELRAIVEMLRERDS